MKRFFSLLKRTPTLAVFIIILLFYMPAALSYPSETERNSIVSAVGIDKEDGKYSLSLLCFVPQANLNYQEKLQVVTCDGNSVSENLEKAGQVLGRSVNLNHIETIILSSDILEEDISIVLDYFARSPVVISGCLVAGTNGKAKDVIETIKDLNDQSGVKVEEIIRHSETSIAGRETTIDSFYSCYYSPISTALISYIELNEEGKNGIPSKSKESFSGASGGESSSGGMSSSQSGGSEEQPKKKELSNLGKMVLLKKGKKQTILQMDEVKALNYFKTNFDKSLISLKNSELEDDKKADVVYEIIENKVLRSISFQNGIPYVRFKLRMKVDLFEVLDDNHPKQEDIGQYVLDENLQNLIEKKIKTEISNLISIFRDKKVDPLGFYDLLMKSDRNKFKDFLQIIDDEDDFLSSVVFAVSVESESV